MEKQLRTKQNQPIFNMKLNRFKSKMYVAIASALLMPVIVSCSYLDVSPAETVDKDDILVTQVDALKYLYSCYGPIQNDDLIRVFRPFNLRQGSDEFVALAPQNADWQRYQWDQPSGANTYYGAFISYYDAIGYCNQFIRDLSEAEIVELNPSDAAQYIAEAKFLKAYFHYKAMEEYGPIPIMDVMLPMDISKEDLPGRSHIDYCAKYIADLCDEAYANLPIAHSNPQYYGRATKAMAKFLKARAYWLTASPLYNGEFPHPTWSNEEYETPGYGTELVSRTYDAQKWETARVACLEAIREADAAGHKLYDLEASEARRLADNIPLPQIPGLDTTTPEGEEFAKRVMLMRYVPVAGPNEGSSEFIWGMLGIAPDVDNASMPHYVITDQNGILRGGWGWISPTLYTVEHFLTANGKVPSEDENFPSEENWFKSAGLNNPDIVNLYVNREPRFYAYIGFDGDEYSPVIKNGAPLILDMKNSQENGYNPNFGANNQSQTGFLNKKMVHPNVRYTGINGNNNLALGCDHPFPLFRVADLYLMYAECCARQNNHLDEGLSYLNKVHTRAGLKAFCESEMSGNGQLLEAVRNEIFSEFYFEARRQLEIRRNVEGDKYMSKSHYRKLNCMVTNPTFEEFNQIEVIDQPFKWNDRMYLYPVVNSEVYANPQLVQAPYY